MSDDDLDLALADRDDAVQMELLDEIVAEYERDLFYDGVRIVSRGS